ncbi:DNA translocase FtsK 4TM domain-containing protein [Roseivirga sp. BDSF3-8]|uniref:FtsK/SpoIIIE family DNA translocase n=1 Tax=Roseivirga sp. BDSF3-8 TaxID=3241598 RepID=UPI003531A1CE
MAKNTYKSKSKSPNTRKKQKKERKPYKLNMSFLRDRRLQLTVGMFLIIAGMYLFTAFLSYLFTGKADQSVVEAANETGLRASGLDTENWLGFFGALVSHFFIYKWFGIAAFLTPPFLVILGYRIVFERDIVPLYPAFKVVFFLTFWISLLLGYVVLRSDGLTEWGFLCGGIGYEMALLFDSLTGWGTVLLLVFALLTFVIYFFNITSMLSGKEGHAATANDDDVDNASRAKSSDSNGVSAVSSAADTGDEDDMPGEALEEAKEEFGKDSPFKEDAGYHSAEDDSTEEDALDESASWEIKDKSKPTRTKADVGDLSLEVEEAPLGDKEEDEDDSLGFMVNEPVKEAEANTQENYDPTLDLGAYKYPTPDLLKEYDFGDVRVTKDELEQNKDNIVETLVNFKIGISSIKATIGPTVTLYEIVPEAGVKISKIKNLEDDIALSLAALGIRIIAPIPGKGTIGIEVPNKNREMVSMHSVVTTEKFMNSDKELPVVLGKTISNEVFVTDLAKMPHLLMAGATGQGKSVGLNVLLTSLIYKKHPSQLKFVLVDPKKVELTLFNKIERHYLAMLPNSEEPIITDTKKVIYTLNSLCIEMDNRYDLLKDAGCRNVKEYNNKFIRRRLNPEKGHRFLPYIVLVIDELADLMMTAGKEVETPIARLAQLARAIGIHLVVATQRPSVNVITGIIKANFPARLSFRVTSKVDSRTILDSGGAEQLVGMGDMLLSMGSDTIRLQCAFVDTPEVESICEWVGSQRGYESAYYLPEFSGDEETAPGEVDLSERDDMFEDAARLIVRHQQGSTSLIQRKLKLGYNRAGRLIDQLEAAGIVGPFEGSKAREVLVQDEYSLEQLLNSLDNS